MQVDPSSEIHVNLISQKRSSPMSRLHTVNTQLLIISSFKQWLPALKYEPKLRRHTSKFERMTGVRAVCSMHIKIQQTNVMFSRQNCCTQTEV